MSEKLLGEAEWKKFSKGRELKDAALVKALAALEKAREPAEQLKALADVGKEADQLRKLGKGDRALAAQLDDLDKALAREQKAAQAALQEAEPADDGGSALLTTKLVAQLRQVRAGERLNALVGVGTKSAVVMLSNTSISPARHRLLTEHLNAGPLKFFEGSCLLEANACTFVLEGRVAGLAKKLAAALFLQTDQRVKVRVRGDDPADVEEGDDDAAAPDAPAGEARPAAAGVPGEAAATPEAATAASAAADAQADAQAQARRRYDVEFAALGPALLAALKAQHPEATRLRAVAGFAREKAEAGDIRAAEAALAQLRKLLAPATPAGAQADAPAATPPGEPARSKVDYAKCRLAWEGARRKVEDELHKLEQAILQEFGGAEGLDEITDKLARLDEVLAGFNEDLSDTLDRALNERDAARQQRYHAEAAAQIRRFQAHAAQDAFISQLEANPFVPIAIRAPMMGSLDVLAKLIA